MGHNKYFASERTNLAFFLVLNTADPSLVKHVSKERKERVPFYKEKIGTKNIMFTLIFFLLLEFYLEKFQNVSRKVSDLVKFQNPIMRRYEEVFVLMCLIFGTLGKKPKQTEVWISKNVF